MGSSSLPSLLAHTSPDFKIHDGLEAPQGQDLVVSTPLLSRDTYDSRQLSRLNDQPFKDDQENTGSDIWINPWCSKIELWRHRVGLLKRFVCMHIDMGFDGLTLVGLGLKGMPGHQWLLRISILAPQLSAWYFLNKNGMSGRLTPLLILLLPVISLLLGFILEPGLLLSISTFAFCLSLEPVRLLTQCWNGGKVTELIWFSIADGLVEAPISAFLTLMPAMLLTQAEGEEVNAIWCASVLWGLLTTALTSSELHFYGDKKSFQEQLIVALFVKLPEVISQVLGYIFFAYLTRCHIDTIPGLQGIEYIALIALLALELALNYSILNTTCERLPFEVALLFSCMMCISGPPCFLQKLDRARWPHAVQHAALTGFMVVVAFLVSSPFPERVLLLQNQYSIFVILYLVSVPWSLVAAYISTQREPIPREDAIRQTQARFAAALKSKDRIMSNLLMSIDGATPCVAPDLLDTSNLLDMKWQGICQSKQSGKLYCAPSCSSEVLVIDPEFDTLSYIETTKAAPWKWEGIAEAMNGHLYCAPSEHSAVLVIDPLQDKISLIETGIEGTEKWSGIAQASNGKLYCAPRFQSAVLVIDPSTNSTELIQTGSEEAKKWSGIAASRNGKVYCTPYHHDSILVIDSSTSSVSFIETKATGPSKWSGITEATNGMLYCVPYNHSSILLIDPTTDSISYIETHDSTAGKWSGVVQSQNGKLYCAPCNHLSVLVINPVTQEVELVETGMTIGDKWRDIAKSSNGIMYCAPSSSADVLKIAADTIDKWDQNQILRDLRLCPDS